jgi:transposase InsO family protein
MSDVGHRGDNAPAEGFFGMLKRERINRRRYRTAADARRCLRLRRVLPQPQDAA